MEKTSIVDSVEWTWNGSMNKWWARLDHGTWGVLSVVLTVTKLGGNCFWWEAKVNHIDAFGLTSKGGRTAKMETAQREAVKHGKEIRRKVRYMRAETHS